MSVMRFNAFVNTTQTHRPSDPTPTVRRHSPSTDFGVIMTALDGGALSLPLKGREIAVLLPLPSGPEALPGRRQGGGQEGDGVSRSSINIDYQIAKIKMQRIGRE